MSGSLGVACEFALLGVRSAVQSEGISEDADGVAGTWDPTAVFTLAVRVHRILSLHAGVRAGPRIQLGREILAGGDPLRVDPWIVTGTFGLVIHPVRSPDETPRR